MGRKKGSANKPKDISEPIEVKKDLEQLQTDPIIKIQEKEIIEETIIETPKPEIIEEPKKEIKKTVKKKIHKLIKKEDPKIDNSKGLPLKWIAVGSLVGGLVIAYLKRDYIFNKYIEFKQGRLIEQLAREGLESIEITKEKVE